jgi:hypothetical protein
MMTLGNVAVQTMVVPLSVATTATASGTADTLGYDEACVVVQLDTGATAIDELDIYDGDTTSSFTAITGLTFGTDTGDVAFPASNTSTAPVVKCNIDMRARQRYLKVQMSPGVTGILGAWCILSRAEEPPNAIATVTEVSV